MYFIQRGDCVVKIIGRNGKNHIEKLLLLKIKSEPDLSVEIQPAKWYQGRSCRLGPLPYGVTTKTEDQE